MLEFDFFIPKVTEATAKLTVHKNSKMGFSAAADKLMHLEGWKWCAFAKDKNGTEDKIIYLIKMNEASDITFTVAKAGDYYYINGKSLLDDLGIDYKDETKRIIFDITAIENNGQTIYKLTKRVIKKRNKKAE
jgi:hypothetical protein